MLLIKKIVKKEPITGRETIKIRIMLKLFGNGTSLLENGYSKACDKKCINPDCENYSFENGCTIKNKLIEDWIKTN